jgi:hypothetical protein
MSPATSSGHESPFTGISVNITNQLDVALDVYDVFDPAAAGQTARYVYTKLGSIAAGATGTITTIRQVSQLEAMYTGTIKELQGWYYYQFPIKLMSGTQFAFGNPPPLTYTIAETDRQSMIQSFLFHKFAMANPNSALTNSLNAALKSGDPKAINAFFAGTQNFKNCTLSSWNAIMTWLTMFTSGWQGPYYLYEAAPSSPPQNYVPTLVGTLNIVSTAGSNTATLALCSQDSTGKLQPLNPPRGSTVVMAGDGTMTDQNPGQDVALTLTPVWMNVIQTTMNDNKPTTSYVSGPTLTGTVAGTKVVSTQTLMPLPTQTGKDKSSAAPSGQTFSTICQVVGLIVGLVMLYEIAEKRFGSKQSAEEKAKGDAKSEKDYDGKIEDIDKSTATENAETFNQASETIASSSKSVAESYNEISTTQQKEVLTETIDSESQTLNEEINTQLENGLTPSQDFETSVQNTMDSFQAAQQQIEKGNLQDATTTMNKAAESMQQTIDKSATEMQQSEVDALNNSAEAVSDAAKTSDALSEAQDQYNEDVANEAEDSGAPTDDVTPETDSIPAEL